MEKERLLFSIQRFDGYYNSVNNKCAVFLALSTFIVGGLVAAYPLVLKHVTCQWYMHVLMAALIAIGVAIMIIVIRASTPYLDSHKASLLYFGTLAGMKVTDFRKRSADRGLDDEMTDLRTQAHDLAVGLLMKFKRLRWAGWLFTAQFIIAIPLLIILIFNLK